MPPRIAWAPAALEKDAIFRKLRQFYSKRYETRITRCTGRKQHLHTEETRSRTSVPIAHKAKSGLEAELEIPQISKDPRIRLRDSLAALQKDAGSFVNISRLNLALRGLDQTPGEESIRVAILGLEDGGQSLKKAKRLLRALLTDPLNEKEEEWERALTTDSADTRPLLFKIGSKNADDIPQNPSLLQELYVSSPLLNKNKLEVLVLRMEPPSKNTEVEGGFEDTALVPTLDIPSNTGRYSPIRLPVHKSLVLADGFAGAASLLSYRINGNREILETAIDLHGYHSTEGEETAVITAPPFHVLDIVSGDKSMQSFRNSADKSWDQEADWWNSNIPNISKWLSLGTTPTTGEMKQPLRQLIGSVLSNASIAVEAERNRQISIALSARMPPSKLDQLRELLSKWSETAHTDLRDQLDIAFHGRRWRKLGWWKLFWRVDDVSMITSDILSQRFLSDTEKRTIHLTGRFLEAGAFARHPESSDNNWAWSAPLKNPNLTEPPAPNLKELQGVPQDEAPTALEFKPWPQYIQATKLQLLLVSVPALQALAQKLVLQAFSTSGLSTALAGLLYASSVSTSIYEAGAVAALGTVWSLRRMQGNWETARSFWEGEVREEGRKAVRETELLLLHALSTPDDPLTGAVELENAQKSILEAEAALKACK